MVNIQYPTKFELATRRISVILVITLLISIWPFGFQAALIQQDWQKSLLVVTGVGTVVNGAAKFALRKSGKRYVPP